MKSLRRWWTPAILVLGVAVVSQCAGGREVTVSVALGVPAKSPDSQTVPPLPTPRPAPRQAVEPGGAGWEEHVTLHVVTTGQPFDESAEEGLMCLAEVRGRAILFAAGAPPEALERKLKTVNRRLDRVRVLVAGDQEGATAFSDFVDATAQARVVVPAGVTVPWTGISRVEEAAAPLEVSPEVFVTGSRTLGAPTQALVIRTGAGWVAVTGCSGPATDDLVAGITESLGSPVLWVVGGVHTGFEPDAASARLLVDRLTELGVRRVAVVPCTREPVREVLRQRFASALLEIQPGAVAVFKP